LEQPACRPDLAPTDYHLFPAALKQNLGCNKYEDETVMTLWLITHDTVVDNTGHGG
jgi:hypothetical protein